jgi:hypothetical protein
MSWTQALEQRVGAARARWRLPDSGRIYAVVAGGSALLAVAVGVGIAKLAVPWPVLGLVFAAAIPVVLGLDATICLACLTAFGLAPFVQPERLVAGGQPLWLVAAVLAAGLMLWAWASHEVAREPAWPFQLSPVAVAALVLATYTVLVLGRSRPGDAASLSAAYLAFPLAVLLSALYLSHPSSVSRLQRFLPVMLLAVTAWALAYVAGSAGGCEPCQSFVGASGANASGLRGTSRVYTEGQQAFLGATVILAGRMLERPTPVRVVPAALALLAVALQGSRAQYVALIAGLVVLLIWRFSRSRGASRVLLIALAALAAYALVTSPVGQRALTGYKELRYDSGNGGYRLSLIDESALHWSAFGSGVSTRTLPVVNLDLGIPNTFVVLGLVGGALQLIVIVAAGVRAFRSRTPTGVWLVAAFVTLVVARPSLPFLESGSSAVAYGVAGGFAAAMLPWRERAASARPP